MDPDIRITAEDIFHRAADLTAQERKLYLDRECAGNDALRRDVEELLSFDNSSAAFLEKPAFEDAARELAKSKSLTDAPSDTLCEEEWALGPYRILSQIGKGGMGVVYLAVDTR